MDDPYYRYDASAERASVGRPSFPGYFTSEAPLLLSNQPLVATDLRGVSSDFPHREITPLRPGAYGLDDTAVGIRPEPGISVVGTGASLNGYASPLQDPNYSRHIRDPKLGASSNIPDMAIETPRSLRNADGAPLIQRESNILFVDGLPTDCTRREVAHLFRPFIGYREIKVVHKQPRRSGDRPMVLCFVEFIDPKCALTAMEALQGYRFDDKKPDSPTLRIQFAHFPLRLPSDIDKQEIGIPR